MSLSYTYFLILLQIICKKIIGLVQHQGSINVYSNLKMTKSRKNFSLLAPGHLKTKETVFRRKDSWG